MVGGLVAILLAGWGVSQLLPNAPDEPLTEVAEPEVRAEVTLSAAPTGEAAAPQSETALTAITADDPVTIEMETPAVEAPPEPTPAPVCDVCPAMVHLSGGTFRMGSPSTEAGREPIEGPDHDVTVPAFSISKTEITYAQWMACVSDGGCGGYKPGAPDDTGMPAVSISWRDATAYAKWLSEKTGRTYRLPSESEWEYAARGGTSTAYWWGDRFDAAKAPRDKMREAASLPENPAGLQGMLGNAREWVQDCYVNGYSDAPADGRAVTSGDCSRRVVRGGSFKSGTSEHRAANRARISVSTRDRQIGFRVVLEEE